MAGRIFIDAGSVATAARGLYDHAAKVSSAGARAKGALASTGGLPPEFRGRAAGLAARTAKAAYASDVFSVMGAELSQRARLATMTDVAGNGVRRKPIDPKKLAVSRRINTWNEKTRARAKAHPGKFHQQIQRIVNPAKPKSAPRPAAGTLKATAAVKDPALALSASLKAAKISKHELEKLLKDGGHDLEKLSKEQLVAEIGAKYGTSAAAKVAMSLGDNWDVRGEVKGDAGASASAAGKLGKNGGRAAVDLSIKATARAEGSVGNDQVRANGGVGVAGGFGVGGAVEASMKDWKLDFKLDKISAAVGIGGEVSAGVSIDFKKIFGGGPKAPPPGAVIALPGADGVLRISRAGG